MVFSSLVFLFLFIPLVYMCYYVVFGLSNITKFRGAAIKVSNAFLMFASLFFYFWGESTYILIILFSTCVDYLAGVLLTTKWTRNRQGSIRPKMVKLVAGGGRSAFEKTMLVVSLAVNLGLLFYFKYVNFGIDSINGLAQNLGFSAPIDPFLNVALPLGISFYTFQSMSYTIDVYRGKVAPTRNFFDFCFFVSFFPQLVAGPIVRYVEIEKQLSERRLDTDLVYAGIVRFIGGFSKKVIIADRLGVMVDSIHTLPPGDLSTPLAWVVALGYTFQIYFDFSGYSDMAIGLAKMLGFHFPENFNHPYRSRNITEFWRRWHMTLSRWFRDYLYIPLGGNRHGAVRTSLNLFVVFFLCGLWHGASWSFVVWGLYHGLFLCGERVIKQKFKLIPTGILAQASTFLVVLVGWVFFRADDLSCAMKILKRMFTRWVFEDPEVSLTLRYYLGNDVILTFILAGILAFIPISELSRKFTARFTHRPVFRLMEMSLLLLVLVYATSCLVQNSYSPFIYFRF